MSAQAVWQYASELFDALDTPLSRRLGKAVAKGDFATVLGAKTDHPDTYAYWEDYYLDSIACSFLKKFELGSRFVKDKNPKRAAIEGWFTVERLNARTNARFVNYLSGSFDSIGDLQLWSFHDCVKKRIRDVLGRLPTDLKPRFSPGVSLSDSHPFTTIPDKVSSRLTITSNALCLLDLWHDTAWARARAQDVAVPYDPLVVRSERHATVAKQWDKDRNISVGPSFNVSYQLAVGQEIRRSLRRNAGLDLEIGQAFHRWAANAASRRKHLCTIDLSDASDRWAKQVVKALLPPDWYSLLETLRVPCCDIDGKTVFLEKFSAMGNGFTFELETLLFYAITAEVMSRKGYNPITWGNIFIYGDDIICPDDCYDDVVAALKWYGHSPNLSKSFHGSTPFRESCGADFFDGHPVRGYYHKKGVFNEPQELISLANGIWNLVVPNNYHSSVNDRLLAFRKRVLERIPYGIRSCRGPKDLGDIVIHDEQKRWSSKWVDSIRYIRAYKPAMKELDLHAYWSGWSGLATSLYGLNRDNSPSPDGSYSSVTPITWRNSERYPSVSGYRIGWVTYS